jgi:acetyltransferase-like isoleucine patch superfamily enzyme
MRRKAANQFYFFSMNFINRLLNEFGEKAQLFLTKLDDNVISADLILHNNYFSSSYLRAFNPKYKNINPNNLLISEQIMWSKSIGCRYFLLHGGQLEGDSLFKFKKSFSKIVAPFYTYQKIHNDEIYNLLAKAHNIIQPSTASDYFPIYRSPRNVIIYKTAVINVPENDKFIHPEAGHIGDFVLIAQSKFTMSKGAQINSGAKIVGNGDFHMGAYSTVSYNVVILTSSDFGKVMNDYAKPEERLVVRGSVSLGDRVFVGAGATISVTPKEPHIMIGDDTIIMANSYVDRSLPAAIKYGKWEPKNEIIITRAHDLG